MSQTLSRTLCGVTGQIKVIFIRFLWVVDCRTASHSFTICRPAFILRRVATNWTTISVPDNTSEMQHWPTGTSYLKVLTDGSTCNAISDSMCSSLLWNEALAEWVSMWTDIKNSLKMQTLTQISFLHPITIENWVRKHCFQVVSQ